MNIIEEGVEVGKQFVTSEKGETSRLCDTGAKRNWILIDSIVGIVITGKSVEGAQLMPPGAQLFRGVSIESYNKQRLNWMQCTAPSYLPQISAPTIGIPNRLKFNIAAIIIQWLVNWITLFIVPLLLSITGHGWSKCNKVMAIANWSSPYSSWDLHAIDHFIDCQSEIISPLQWEA